MKKIMLVFFIVLPARLFSQNGTSISNGVEVAGIRIEFIFFALTLLGVAIFHNKTLLVALTGLAAILILKFVTTDFNLIEHLEKEWHILINLLGLLLGFAVLAQLFIKSNVPENLPAFLPAGWQGCFVLLVCIFFISAFLDNIAAALIGGSAAFILFKGKVHIGYIAAIVAAGNAGGSGSILGDTTTTMMWINGINAADVFPAYIAAIPALFIFGITASVQQNKMQPVIKANHATYKVIDYKKIFVCILILAGAVVANFLINFPAAGVWAAILIGSAITKIPWKEIPNALNGALFLLSLVICASLMPVEQLPAASWQSAFLLGFVSAVFDNIPLTKLALDRGGFDWGMLAYTVGFGGSMLWFGSSAGVAISSLFPQAKSVLLWLRKGWYISVAYVAGFFILMATVGWQPHAQHTKLSEHVYTDTVFEPQYQNKFQP